MLRGAEAELIDLLSDKWVGVGGDEKYPVTPVPAVLEVAKSPRRVFMASLSALVVDHSAVPASAAFIMAAMLCNGDTFYTADVVRCAVSRCPTHPSALLLAYPLTPTQTHPSPLHVTPSSTPLPSHPHQPSKYSFVAAQGRHGVFCFHDDQPRKPIYSYVTVPDPTTNLIADVKEKVKISNLANSGC